MAYLFTLSSNPVSLVWWTFPIAEILTSIISIFILKSTYHEKIAMVDNNIINNN